MGAWASEEEVQTALQLGSSAFVFLSLPLLFPEARVSMYSPN